MEHRWLKVKEAAAYIDVHFKTLYDLIAKGVIPYSRIRGIGIRIDKRRLDEMLEAEEIPTLEEQLR